MPIMAGIGRNNPKSGRRKGTPNKNKTPKVAEIAERLGINPFEILLLFAAGDWQRLGYASPTRTQYSKSGEPYEVDVIEPGQRIAAAASACPYLFPKLQAIQLHTTGADTEDPCPDMTDEELDEA